MVTMALVSATDLYILYILFLTEEINVTALYVIVIGVSSEGILSEAITVLIFPERQQKR